MLSTLSDFHIFGSPKITALGPRICFRPSLAQFLGKLCCCPTANALLSNCGHRARGRWINSRPKQAKFPGTFRCVLVPEINVYQLTNHQSHIIKASARYISLPSLKPLLLTTSFSTHSFHHLRLILPTICRPCQATHVQSQQSLPLSAVATATNGVQVVIRKGICWYFNQIYFQTKSDVNS